MNRRVFFFFIFLIGAAFGASGCSSGLFSKPITSAQAIAIGTPLVTGGLDLVLTNNPAYIPIAQKVGADLTAANWSDLTLTGVNSAIALVVAKEHGDSKLAAQITTAIDAGLLGYLNAVNESSLVSDPNAVAVLQALGTAITNAATAAAANPKA